MCSMCMPPTTARVLDWRCWRRSLIRKSRWRCVADPNARAQAFYRKHGFVADGTAQVEGGVREIRMVRGMQHSR